MLLTSISFPWYCREEPEKKTTIQKNHHNQKHNCKNKVGHEGLVSRPLGSRERSWPIFVMWM